MEVNTPNPYSNILDDPSCSICFEAFSNPVRLTCGHIFDFECINDWVNKSGTCPFDRTIVDMTQIEYCDGLLNKMKEVMQKIDANNFLWKSLYHRDFCPPYQESENYEEYYKIALSSGKTVYIKNYFKQQTQVIYNDKTTVLDMKQFIFNLINNPIKHSKPNDIRLHWINDPINGRGKSLQDQYFVKDYKIPAGAILGIDLAGYPLKFKNLSPDFLA